MSTEFHQWQRVLAGIYDSVNIYAQAHLVLYRGFRFVEQSIFLIIITTTTFASTVNLSMNMVPENSRSIVTACIGGLNLFVAVLRSVSEKMDIVGKVKAERMACSLFSELENTMLLNLYGGMGSSAFVSDSTVALNGLLGTTSDVPIEKLQWIITNHRVADVDLLQLPSVLRQIGSEVVTNQTEVDVAIIVNDAVPIATTWSSKSENLSKLYMERSQVYTILYGHAFRRMQVIGYCLSMPSIVLSTIAGTGNFALSSISSENQGLITLVLGLMSSSTIVISAIESFFEITSQRDAFARAQSRYDSISRRIVAQLSLPRGMRTVDGDTLLREAMKLDIAIQNEVPPLPDSILKSFVALDTHHTPANIRIDPFLPILASFTIASEEDAIQENIAAEQKRQQLLRADALRKDEIESIARAYDENMQRIQSELEQRSTELKISNLERDRSLASLHLMIEKSKGSHSKHWKYK